MTGRLRGEEATIPFVLVGVVALGGVLGLAWAGQEWAQGLLREAGGELTVWVLRGAFWALDLVALQASATTGASPSSPASSSPSPAPRPRMSPARRRPRWMQRAQVLRGIAPPGYTLRLIPTGPIVHRLSM